MAKKVTRMNMQEALAEAKRRWGLTAWVRKSRYARGLKYAGAIEIRQSAVISYDVKRIYGYGNTWEQVFKRADECLRREIANRKEENKRAKATLHTN